MERNSNRNEGRHLVSVSARPVQTLSVQAVQTPCPHSTSSQGVRTHCPGTLRHTHAYTQGHTRAYTHTHTHTSCAYTHACTHARMHSSDDALVSSIANRPRALTHTQRTNWERGKVATFGGSCNLSTLFLLPHHFFLSLRCLWGFGKDRNMGDPTAATKATKEVLFATAVRQAIPAHKDAAAPVAPM